jgi:Pilus assembly protein, PilO
MFYARHIFTLVILPTAIGVMGVRLLGPPTEAASAAHGRLFGQEQSLAGTELADVQAMELDRNCAQMRQLIARFKTQLPAQSDGGHVLVELKSAASENGLHSAEIMLTPYVAQSGYTESIAHIDLDGSFDSICGFMTTLEQLHGERRLIRMQLNRDDRLDNQIRAAIDLVIFFRSGA